MPKVIESNKRMFYRLMNHLIEKNKKDSSEIPLEYIVIIKKYQKKYNYPISFLDRNNTNNNNQFVI